MAVFGPPSCDRRCGNFTPLERYQDCRSRGMDSRADEDGEPDTARRLGREFYCERGISGARRERIPSAGSDEAIFSAPHVWIQRKCRADASRIGEVISTVAS